MREVQTSLLRIEVAADGIRYLRNIAKGEIDFIKVINDGFESLTDYGMLQVMFTNTDILTGSFSLSITNCSYGILVSP